MQPHKIINGLKINDEPGELRLIHKSLLCIDRDYQRPVTILKVKELAENWSWVACGAIVIGRRDGVYFVIDGQHRVYAAMKRREINDLPCLVFESTGKKQEAGGFLGLNGNRKPVTSLGKFSAQIVSEDETACYVKKILSEHGIVATDNSKLPRALKSIGWCIKRANEDKQKFFRVILLSAELCSDMVIKEKLLEGLWFIDDHISGGILDKRFRDRINHVGAKRVLDGAFRAAAFYVKGGAAVWAAGIIEEMNKGTKNKFTLNP